MTEWFVVAHLPRNVFAREESFFWVSKGRPGKRLQKNLMHICCTMASFSIQTRLPTPSSPKYHRCLARKKAWRSACDGWYYTLTAHG